MVVSIGLFIDTSGKNCHPRCFCEQLLQEMHKISSDSLMLSFVMNLLETLSKMLLRICMILVFDFQVTLSCVAHCFVHLRSWMVSGMCAGCLRIPTNWSCSHVDS